MTQQSELVRLLRSLAAADSPLERLHIVALAWRTVRGLTAEERRRLAQALAVKGASEIVEALARRRGGLGPAEVLRAVKVASEGRTQALDALAAAAADALEEELGQDEGARPPRVEPQEESVPPVSEGGEGGAPAQIPEPAGQAETSPSPGTPEEAEPEEAGRDGPEVRPPPPEERETPAAREGAAPEASRPPETAAAAGEQGPPEARADQEVPAGTEGPPGPVKVTATAGVTEVEPRALPEVGDGPAQAGVMADLLALRRLLRERSSDPEELVQRIEGLPSGWARRRAILAVIEAGAVPPSRTLEVIAGLADRGNRVWCLTALVRTTSLTARDLARAEDLAGPAAARRIRRLARRMRPAPA